MVLDRWYLQLVLEDLRLLQLVPDGLRVSGPVVPLQEVELGVAETFLQLLERVAKLKRDNVELKHLKGSGGSTCPPRTQQTGVLRWF